MKTACFTGLAIVAGLLLGISPRASAQNILDKWPELNTFHSVMSQTFHPMEDGNFKPIRARSAEMYQKASALAKAKIPAEFNKPEVVTSVKSLKAGSKALDKAIRNGATDKEVEQQLVALHDVFHAIVGACVGH